MMNHRGSVRGHAHWRARRRARASAARETNQAQAGNGGNCAWLFPLALVAVGAATIMLLG